MNATPLQQLFAAKHKNILNIYCTAGYPTLHDTAKVIAALQHNGADIIELGMPYSDPVADGETIQQSNAIALQNGMTIALLLQQLNDCKATIKIPLILMGYLNPILQFGFEKFCEAANKAGVSGLIIPDIPVVAYTNTYKAIVEKYNLNFIFLITPNTSIERIKLLDSLSTGFIYAVSSNATTGASKDFNDVNTYLQQLQSLQLRNPILVGFGIKDKATFTTACTYTNGAIIGSAYIQALQSGTDIETTTTNFLQKILN